MYALYQSGYAVYGTGETIDECRRDAAEHLDGGIDAASDAEIIQWKSENNGGLYIRECTVRLAEKVRAVGGDIQFCVTKDGMLDLAD